MYHASWSANIKPDFPGSDKTRNPVLAQARIFVPNIAHMQ